jgi:hypothetical protein
MARRFAAVLGLVAFAAMMFRGVADGWAEETVIRDAIGFMLLLAIVGAFAGWIADLIVSEAADSKSSQRQSM